MDLTNEIWAYALKNAIDYGKVDSGKILPKLFQHGLDKKEIGKIMPSISEIAGKVNSMSKEEKEKTFEKYKKFVKEREEKEKTLPELPNAVMGKVVTRLPPEPSKYLHIGHALSFLLNYLYAKRYAGKCLLRFEDCNPEKVNQEFIDSILDDIQNYLDIKVDTIKFVSDDMTLLIDYAEKLINMDKAYVCFCDRETMQNLRHDGKECPCRKNKSEKNLLEWKNMQSGKYKEGKAVLRIKGDMKDNNHVMRDSVIFRIVLAKHFRHKDKYKVWPMYDFYNPIEDSLMGVTHILRSNEFEQRVPLQDYIKELLGLDKQTVVQYGRFNVIESTTKGREIRELIESGTLMGWDDPRLVTLKALKRRGITKEAFYELVEQMGLSKYAVNLDFDMIAAINRKIIDPIANRYSFVKDPIEIEISDAPDVKEIEVLLHPDKPTKRKVKVGKNIFISKNDFEELKGKEIRLLHLYNIKLGDKIVKDKVKAKFTSSQVKPMPKINWVCFGLKTKVLMDDGTWIEGLADEGITDLKPETIVQFERNFFCKLDKVSKSKYEFWFTHK